MTREPALFDAPRRAGRPRKVLVTRAFADTVAACSHLRPEDAALVELGRRLAAEVDACDDEKVLTALTGQMVAVLDRLGVHPKGRAQLGLEQAAEEVNPLDELRSIRESRRAAQVDAGT